MRMLDAVRTTMRVHVNVQRIVSSYMSCATFANSAPQARNNKTASGDLAKKLDAQKRQTNNQTLQQAANENRLAREADQATETRNYN
jgi:hypothetical protein